MPLPLLHPLPPNPTTGQQPLPSLSSRYVQPPSGRVTRDILKSLQDIYWSDDDDDPDCLLCAEPLDLSDLNFKPCQCGLQICQFCYNKLLSTDSRCPGCRRPYDTKAVVFEPVDWEEVKKAKEKKAKKAKVIKQLTGMGRRHYLGVRIVMKNTAYVVGMKLPSPGDEAISILRSNDYFGQYGKISKLYFADPKPSVGETIVESDDSPAGIYIVYVRREDAARCISSLDGIPAPQGPLGATLKVTYGTARYCEAFLKGSKCDNANCHCLHEWGGESDCFTKEDMEIAQCSFTKPLEYDARQRLHASIQPQPISPSPSSKVAWPKPSGEDGQPPMSATGLPSAASWGKGIGTKFPGRTSVLPRAAKMNGLFPLTHNSAAFPLPTPSPTIPIIYKEKKEKKSSVMARAKSTDSNQSATLSSSQTSPKRKNPTLSDVQPTASSMLVSSEATPHSSSASGAGTASLSAPMPVPASAIASDLIEDSVNERSPGSDVGPSSDSPAPQTPARLTQETPPLPLSSEPIPIHSPYPEPVIFAFPQHDKNFAFVLDLGDGELQRHQVLAEGYEPSPFNKTLEGLAELGVHAPEVPELFVEPITPVVDHYSGFFRPFETDEGSPAVSDRQPGEGESLRQEEDHNAQRTESRFNFARSNHQNNDRAASPLGLPRKGIEQGWYRQDPLPSHSGGMSEMNVPSSSTVAQLGNQFGGGFDSTSSAVGNEIGNGWTGNDSGSVAVGGYSASPAMPRQGAVSGLQGYDRNGSMGQAIIRRQYMQNGPGDRGDLDNSLLAVLQYSTNPQLYSQHLPQQRSLFSPDSATHSIHDDATFTSSMTFSGLQQAQQTQMQHHPDARQLMQMHQRRGQSPGSMSHRKLNVFSQCVFKD
nr:CCR4-NOT transcription complex subunit 4 [Cryptococcus depauperatus CBS 7841]